MRLKVLRDLNKENSYYIEKELNEINDILGPEESLPDNEPEHDINWTRADDSPAKEGIWLKDLQEGMVGHEVIIGQIKNIFDIKTFAKKDKDGKDVIGRVQNIVLSDSSGDMLCVFWDDTIDKITEFLLGEHVEITQAWQVKRNKKGILELHPGNYFKIKRVE